MNRTKYYGLIKSEINSQRNSSDIWKIKNNLIKALSKYDVNFYIEFLASKKDQ